MWATCASGNVARCAARCARAIAPSRMLPAKATSLSSLATAVYISGFSATRVQAKKTIPTISVQLYCYKWKNHFAEMKGDVGMSLHEKEGEQEHA